MSPLASTLRARRKELKLTLDKLARRARCSKAYLSGTENDKFPHAPSEAMLARMERGLKLPPGALQKLADWQDTPEWVKERLEACGLRLEDFVGTAALSRPDSASTSSLKPQASSLLPPLRQ